MWSTIQHLWITCLTIIIINSSIVSSQDISVKYNTPSKNDTYLTTTANSNIRYISLYEFADLFNARTYFSEKTKKMIIYLESKVIKVTAFNPFIIVDENTYQLTANTYIKKNDIYVPLNDFIDIIKKVFPDNISYNNMEGKIEISPPTFSNINFIDINEKANGTLIKISTSRSFSKSELGLRERHGWLYVDVYGGRVDSVALSKEVKNRIISRILPSQISEQMAQISFRLKKQIVEKQLYLENANEILISLKTKEDITEKITTELEREKKKWLIDKIVIDPGHGGKDPGAIGPGGTYEKDVILSIALKLRDIIRKKSDIQVLMTRDDDRSVALEHRTEFANKNEAKLFISIHANANPSRRIKGVTTYFLGPEKSDEAREVALLENSAIKYESRSKYADLSNENFILSAMAQNVYNTESQDLAAMVQSAISEHCNLSDRGVIQAGFLVLWRASMPNILIETAYISNQQEERKLKTSAFQNKIAEAIFNGIMEFKHKYEWGI